MKWQKKEIIAVLKKSQMLLNKVNISQIVIMIKVLMKRQKWQMVFEKRQWSLKVMW